MPVYYNMKMLRSIFLLSALIYFGNSSLYAQDNTFSFICSYKDEASLFKLADSLKKPLFVSQDKIYAIGIDCISNFLDGTIQDRNKDGQVGNRNIEGNSNNRLNEGTVSERKKGKGSDNRDRDGSSSDRDKDGKSDNRNNAGDSNNRNNTGLVSEGPRCEVKGNKILLYSRLKLDPEKSKIYYLGSYFDQKYFKIIKL